MLYERHGAAPAPETFQDIRLETPNYSGRMDNLRAALIRDGLEGLNCKVERWNRRYRLLEEGFRKIEGLSLPERSPREHYVGSSIPVSRRGARQRRHSGLRSTLRSARGSSSNGSATPNPRPSPAATDSWRYLGDPPELPGTLDALSKTLDLRVPLTFTEDDCRLITTIVGDCLTEA